MLSGHAWLGICIDQDAGDVSTAVDVARFMGQQQRDDGSMPQNTNLEAVPVWTAQQMDETADAILLAVRLSRQLSAGDGPDITRAADYIVRTGPITQQERWEEAGGYSPATIAAEIAALDAAVLWSRKQSRSLDHSSEWAAAARRWDAELESDTFTHTGALGSGYYVRISAGGHPDTATWSTSRTRAVCGTSARSSIPASSSWYGSACARHRTLAWPRPSESSTPRRQARPVG